MMRTILCILLLKSVAVFSQWIDPGSLSGSSAATFQYMILGNADRNLTRQVNRFTIQYSKRIPYLMLSSSLTKKINTQIDTAIRRYNFLVSRNNSLVFFRYSRKRNNAKALTIIKKMLDNLERELNKQNSIGVIHGEKLNLYQNAMKSLSKIHRLMDIIEDNVAQSKLLDAITRRK
ncbi:hypothetical protein [Aquimarina mytili]|uniref:DUF4142 domain-containing protein n=1 Tax=Aquimarina mytili TaxID=874423 RepID=A0A936ZYE1_9FLAO|nr:hypothetical protein [Aquimarina mytili]MBL0683431.1 hypothetical protein [Aquimarina mytili]